MSDENARLVLQDVLDAGAKALMQDDPDLFFRYVHFPHVLITEDEEIKATCRDELMPRFISVSSALNANGVTDYVRIARDCMFASDGALIGQWTTHIIRRDHRLVAPYPCRTRLIEKDGVWQMTHAIYALRFESLPGRFPVIAEKPHLRDLSPEI